MPLHPLTSFEIQKYYQNEPRFNGVYVINLDEYSDIETHWVSLHVHNNDAKYFDSFGVEHIPKQIRTFINNKNIKTNFLEHKHMI